MDEKLHPTTTRKVSSESIRITILIAIAANVYNSLLLYWIKPEEKRFSVKPNHIFTDSISGISEGEHTPNLEATLLSVDFPKVFDFIPWG